jgi:hypothetical protein
MRNTRNWKELKRLIRKLGYFLKIGAVTDLEPDSDLEEAFTSLPIKRRMEILRREFSV